MSQTIQMGEDAVGSSVDAALTRLLARPDMVPGARLPTERALATELGVARSAVRAALSRLEARRAIVRVMGSGTYVADRVNSSRPSNDTQDASPAEIMETRLLMEPRMARLIVTHAGRADLEKIRRACEGGRAATEFAAFETWDARFHQALAEATKNRLVIRLYEAITTSRDLTEWGELKRRSVTENRRQFYRMQHDDILKALLSRDTDQAEIAIRDHLVTVRDNLFGDR